MPIEVYRLKSGNCELYAAMLDLFGTVFDEHETYNAFRPSPEYVAQLLANPSIVSLVAIGESRVVGALVAYELPKFEQARSEFYIYDLGVDEAYRRQGIATSLIAETCNIARQRGGWTVFVQADQGDEAAIALYTGLGVREDVLHFDIPAGKVAADTSNGICGRPCRSH